MMLCVNKLSVSYDEYTVLSNVSFCVDDGQWLMITGRNGAGKSTIVNAIAQCVGYSGSIELFGNDITKICPKERAKYFGILRQGNYVNYSFSVEEVVRLGRYAYREAGLFSFFDTKESKKNDDCHVDEALFLTGLSELRERSVLTLSGGELQRVFLAQLFAQNPKLLILDEPTNHLDLSYQKIIFDLIRSWLQEGERAVISVVHDLSLAKMYGTHALLLNGGKTLGFGDISDVLTRDKLMEAYDFDVQKMISELADVWK